MNKLYMKINLRLIQDVRKMCGSYSYRIVSILVAIMIWGNVTAQNRSFKKNKIIIAKSVLADKIAGGLTGQLLGNLNGLQYEFKFLDSPGHIVDYVPSLPNGAFTDDDTDIEWVYITEMAKTNTVLVPPHRMRQLWQTFINRKVWSANRFARQLFDLGIEPPLSGKRVMNNWADFNLAGMFLSESFGLVAPFMPQTAAAIGVHYTSATVDGEPLQATLLITSMIATAFKTNDVKEIVAAGKMSLDKKSNIFMIVQQVEQWCDQYPDDWKRVRELIKDTYTQKELSGGARHVGNMNGCNLNAAATIAAVLLGKGDFIRSVIHAFNFGWDADCNAATVGAITGVIKGKSWMDSQHWNIKDVYANTTREGMPEDETISGFSKKITDVAGIIIQQQGGRSFTKNGIDYYEIKTQRPRSTLTVKDVKTERLELAALLKDKIYSEYRSLDTQTRARAAYLAIATDVYKDIKKADEQGWMKAVAALETFPRVIDILLKPYPDPLAPSLSNRAKEAGVSKPAVAYKWPEDY